MRNEDKIVGWKEGDAGHGQSFAGYVQTSPDKTATSLDIMALLAYGVHAVLTNSTYLY